MAGNHDQKLRKALSGRDVEPTHGLAETLAAMNETPPAFRERVEKFINGLPTHYVLDGGALVVAHAGLTEELQGRTSATRALVRAVRRHLGLLLKRPEHLTDAQEDRLADLVRRNLRTVRAYLLKEDFQSLWGYVSPYWAGQVPRPLVHSADALAARPDEGRCPHGALAPRPDRLVSCTWRPARTETHPQIMLTRPKLLRHRTAARREERLQLDLTVRLPAAQGV